MLILSPAQATAGMALAAPVQHPLAPDQTLLTRGFVLDAPFLARLVELGVPAILVEYPSLTALDRHAAVLISPQRLRLYSQVRSTFESLQRSSRFEPDFHDYYACVRDLVLTLMGQGPRGIYLDLMARTSHDLVAHCTAVAHLSLLLGLRLESYLLQQRRRLDPAHARDVVNLGVAAMLHDIGKTRLDAALASFTAINPPTDPEALRAWQQHATKGYQMIHQGVEATAASAVLHHHQSFAGGGFPVLGLPGKTVSLAGRRIHIFARILTAADLFDRVATSGDQGRRLSNLRVLHRLRSEYAERLDPIVLRALHCVAPPYPPGSFVTLSDQRRAAVVSIPDADPFRPTLLPLTGEPPLPDPSAEAIDLRNQPELAITHAGDEATAGLTCTPEEIAPAHPLAAAS